VRRLRLAAGAAALRWAIADAGVGPARQAADDAVVLREGKRVMHLRISRADRLGEPRVLGIGRLLDLLELALLVLGKRLRGFQLHPRRPGQPVVAALERLIPTCARVPG